MKRLEDCDFLDRDQWDIYRGPDDMLYEARAYEFARQSRERSIAVNRWRENAKEHSFEGYLALYRDPKAPQAPRPVLGSDLYVLFPEWPDIAFHTIDPALYAQRQQCLCPWHERELRARRFKPDPALWLESEYGFERAMRGLWATWQKLRRWCIRPNDFSETHLIQVDWWDSKKRLMEDFDAWIDANRPADCQPYLKQGGGTYERQWRSDLKALAALRLQIKAERYCQKLCIEAWRILVEMID